MLIIDILKKVPDHRDPQGQKYKIWEILFVTILTILANGKTYPDIERFVKTHRHNLQRHFGIKWDRVPMYQVIRKILINIDQEGLEEAFRLHGKTLLPKNGIKQLCFDGKVMRGSNFGEKCKQPVAFLSAFSALDKISIAHVSLEEKDSEITGLYKFLEQIDLNGVIVTADAAHCQKKL